MVRHYESVRHISTDSFGVTMLVKADEKRLHALKTIDIGRVRRRDQLLNEVANLSKLCHPNLLATREVFLDGGLLCIVSDYVEGGHVAGKVEKAKKLNATIPQGCYLSWFAQAALALAYLHSCNVVHADLRTRRLLLTLADHVVIAGFAVPALHEISFSPDAPDLEMLQYISPEFVAGKDKLTAAGDIWSLGVILYETVTLQPLFEHPHPRGLVQKVTTAKIPALPVGCSSEVRGLCDALLQRDPNSRPRAVELLRGQEVQQCMRSLFNEDRKKIAGMPESEDRSRGRSQHTAASLPFGYSSIKSPGSLMLTAPVKPLRTLRPLDRSAGPNAKLMACPRAALRRPEDKSKVHLQKTSMDLDDEDVSAPGPSNVVQAKRPDTREVVIAVMTEAIEEHLEISSKLQLSEEFPSLDFFSDYASTVMGSMPQSREAQRDAGREEWREAGLDTGLGSSLGTPRTPQRWNLPSARHSRDFPKFS